MLFIGELEKWAGGWISGQWGQPSGLGGYVKEMGKKFDAIGRSELETYSMYLLC